MNIQKHNHKKNMEDLIIENNLLKKTIQVQHETINRLMDTYVLKQAAPKVSKNLKK